MPASLTTFNDVLKNDYQPTLREQLNNANKTLTQLERKSDEVDVQGKYAVLALHVGRNTGVGSRAENATLPTAGAQGYVEERVPLKYHYGRLQISGPSIEATRTDRGSYVRAVESESRGLKNDLLREMSRQLWNDTPLATELTSIPVIVDDSGTLFNVDSSVTTSWKSNVDDGGGTDRPITDAIIQTALMDTNNDSDGTPDLFITSAGVFRAYGATLVSQKQFVNTNELKGGFTGISVEVGDQSATLIWDKDAPAGTIFGIDTDAMAIYQANDWSFMDRDHPGTVLHRVPNVDAYEATMYRYFEIATDRRNAHIRIDDIEEL